MTTDMTPSEAKGLLDRLEWEMGDILLAVASARKRKKDPARELGYTLMIDTGTAEALIEVAKQSPPNPSRW